MLVITDERRITMAQENMENLRLIYTEHSFMVDEIRLTEKMRKNPFVQMFLTDKIKAFYELGFQENGKGLHNSVLFLYKISDYFIKELSSKPELEIAREKTQVELDEDQIEYLLNMAPFAIGSEYIVRSWIIEQIELLNEQFYKQMVQYKGTVQLYLQEKSQNLKVAKRIYFHLVENEGDADFPFAFLATYATKDDQGRIRHMPLRNALIEYQNDRKQLLNLLSCLNDAAKDSALIVQFMETGDIYHPIKMTSKEAYIFLNSVPLFEKCGITCRVPNWWKKKYHNVSVNVSVGDKQPSLLGFDSILSLQPSLCVNGTPLTKKDITRLLMEEEGLTWLKGQWVEVNHNRLKQLLEQLEDYTGTVTLKQALTKEYFAEKEIDVDLGIEISNGLWLNQTLMELKHPEKIKKKARPKCLNAKLRPYQVSGYNWLNQMSELGFGACLADDMGLGKTLQVIAYLEKLRENNPKSRVLLVVPASLLGNWSKEIDKFAPRLDYCILHGKSAPLRIKDFENVDKFLTITTYGMALRLEILQTIQWDCLILDEAQAIKNPVTKQTRTLKKIPSKMRIALTGTPIENDLTNLWSLFDFLNKGLLGSSKEFKEYTKNMMVDAESTSKLKALISPFILRRLKTDKKIISDLPDKIEILDHVDLSKRQIVLYRKEVEKTKERIENSEGFERRGVVLALLTKLKQICNHPDEFIKDTNFDPKDSGKFTMLKELCETIYEKRERVLVFTQYKEMCEPLSKYLESIFHKKGYIVHGSIPVKERTKIVEQFNDTDHYIPYIVLSLRAAGTGLNLVSANHVIHFDRWWNPAVENQASDRAYRIGQKKNVFIHKLISNGTIEEKIDQLISSKKELAESILATSKENWITELDNEQLMELLRLDV